MRWYLLALLGGAVLAGVLAWRRSAVEIVEDHLAARVSPEWLVDHERRFWREIERTDR